jgi:hypothetical protein
MSVIEVDAGDREFNAVSFDAKFMNGDIWKRKSLINTTSGWVVLRSSIVHTRKYVPWLKVGLYNRELDALSIDIRFTNGTYFWRKTVYHQHEHMYGGSINMAIGGQPRYLPWFETNQNNVELDGLSIDVTFVDWKYFWRVNIPSPTSIIHYGGTTIDINGHMEACPAIQSRCKRYSI